MIFNAQKNLKPKPAAPPTFRAKFNEKGWTIIDRHNKHVACGRWFADLPLPVAEAETKERLTEYVKGHGKAGDVSYQRILLFDRVKAARV